MEEKAMLLWRRNGTKKLTRRTKNWQFFQLGICEKKRLTSSLNSKFSWLYRLAIRRHSSSHWEHRRTLNKFATACVLLWPHLATGKLSNTSISRREPRSKVCFLAHLQHCCGKCCTPLWSGGSGTPTFASNPRHLAPLRTNRVACYQRKCWSRRP